jgi:hypothetical protein
MIFVVIGTTLKRIKIQAFSTSAPHSHGTPRRVKGVGGSFLKRRVLVRVDDDASAAPTPQSAGRAPLLSPLNVDIGMTVAHPPRSGSTCEIAIVTFKLAERSIRGINGVPPRVAGTPFNLRGGGASRS